MGSGAPTRDVHSRARRCGTGWGRKCGSSQPLLRLTLGMSTITSRTINDGMRGRLLRFSWHHPEWWVVLAAAAAWMFMAGMAPLHTSHTGIISGRGQVHGTLGMVAMVIAMMVPLTITNVRHVALSSLWRRRNRAIAAFLVGYLAVWIVVQTIIVGTWVLLAAVVEWGVAGGVAIIAATLWEVASINRQSLRRCHRTVPFAPRGWRADVDCVHYGVTTGFNCVMMCWALMVAATAFSHSLMVMTILFGVQVSGRYRRRPSPVLAALAVLGVCLLSIAAQFAHHPHH
jgi:predicted metal-binding membrane protein